MDINSAAWLTRKNAFLEVNDAPLVAPTAHQIVIKNGAVAINPVEWCKQLMGNLMFSWIKYPFILGNDCAGEIVQIGDAVSRFKIGDRVLAHALGMDPTVNNSAEGAFQRFTIIRDNMASLIPERMSYEEACVLPLAVSTAACALFQQDYLALEKPNIDNLGTLTAPPKYQEFVLVWGGSTSVGCNAIQLATAAGYKVIATSSPKNFKYLHDLGANKTFDYASETVIHDIIESIGTKRVAGAIAIGNGSTEACIQILSKTNGSKFIAQISFPFPGKIPQTKLGVLRAMAAILWSNITIFFKSKLTGTKTKFVFGSSLANNEVGAMIYHDFLPRALEEEKYVPAPKAVVSGQGLAQIQPAMMRHMEGVSASKIVVSL
ncbi:Polyketide synthase enoylreductase [Penicillium soppii]|uniref:Polyketide synthase enoylreductase n=1 Tax=Penicillium soppii TaxID=69789 RepID=UPI002547F33C|nr:Polyketide synthase enoylreductase [Penicillium soppii]KAJ5864572.1 Polyketide synthase enoylreductase [Penicillium soppii]